ncbi:gliding motility lipoprotein GldD [Namhaeicola litoreus]|uniref:Gliding motility lipoprotein GldD n=1 Tax=Namhaeicola litoreus TaxID=1052145 RepID=A0ABW3XWZ1_9FLAO
MNRFIFYCSFFILVTLFSCKEDIFPKPKAQLRLQYPDSNYLFLTSDCPYTFEYSELATISTNEKCWTNIYYPTLKASINITYRPIENNLQELFMESEKLTFNHTIKADGISSLPFANKEHQTYGSLFEVTGNAASPLQFHLTDSIKHFITGAVYFDVSPNFDSIQPAISYIEKDLQKIMETTSWKN